METNLDSVNVLYCGMGDDIINPIMMFPNMINLYAIDAFDPAFSSKGTVKSQRDDIVQALRGKALQDRTESLPKKARVLQEVREPGYFNVVFEYEGVARTLHYFRGNYRLRQWPPIIQNIDTFIFKGAPFPLSKSETHEKYFKRAFNNMKRMVSERFLDRVFCVYGTYSGSAQQCAKIKNYSGDDQDDCDCIMMEKTNELLILDKSDV